MQFISRELTLMSTLQVGLVGRDGAVLASDRRVIYQEAGHEVDYDMDDASKLYQNEHCVCCWSGETAAMRAAERIRDRSWNDQTEVERRQALEGCAAYAWRSVYGSNGPTYNGQRTSCRVLAAFLDGSLWELEVFRDSSAKRREVPVVVGVPSSARHVTLHYVPPPSSSIKHLILPAAHTLLMASKENPHSVMGLDVAIIPKGGPIILLSSEQKDHLARLSEDLYSDIRKRLSISFDYNPIPE